MEDLHFLLNNLTKEDEEIIYKSLFPKNKEETMDADTDSKLIAKLELTKQEIELVNLVKKHPQIYEKG